MARRSRNKTARGQDAVVAQRAEWPWGVALFAAVILAYVPVWSAAYAWDDKIVFVNNPVIVGPLGLKEIWTTKAADICPLTLSTFWLEFNLWGADPLLYHIVNVLFHGGCAVMLWRVLRALLVPGAWFGAALWALHPLQVESVAWISEMKNTESGLFFLCAILFFIRVLKAKETRMPYALTLLFAALAMASKSSTVVLPAILLLVAWWVQRRWQWRNLFTLAPVIAMALIASVVTFWTQQKQVVTFGDIPDTRGPLERLLAAADVIWFYLGKLAWPERLMPIYPRWQIDTADVLAYVPLLALVVVLGLIASRRTSWSRAILFATGCFITALTPCLGIVSNAFSQFSYVSDHFQYLAGMAPLALLAAAISVAAKKWLPGAIWARPMFAGAALFLLGVLTCLQTSVYHDDISLWTYAVEHNPQCWVGYNNLGTDFYKQGRLGDSIEKFRKAVEVRPDYPVALNNLGAALVEANKPAEAEAAYRKATTIEGRDPTMHGNLGDLLVKEDRFDEALVQYDAAIAIDPDNAGFHNGRGVALAGKGDFDNAISEIKTALRLDPNLRDAQTNLDIIREMKTQKAAGK